MKQAKKHGMIRWRGSSWEVVHTIDRKRHYSTYHGDEDDEDGAREYANARYEELKKDLKKRRRGINPDMRMSELIALFRESEIPLYDAESTKRGYLNELDIGEVYWVDRRGDLKVRDLMPLDVTDFRTWRRTFVKKGNGHKTLRTTTCSKATVNGSVRFLHLLLEWARTELMVIDANPASRPRRSRGRGRVGRYDNRRRPEILSGEQYADLLRECFNVDDNPKGGAACREPTDLVYGYVLLVGEAGLRNESEALWVRFEDIDFDGGEHGFIWVHDDPETGHRTKGRDGRWVPMTPILRRALMRLTLKYANNGTNSPWLFHYTQPARRIRPGDRIQSMRKRVNIAAAKAGLPNRWVMYDLRHRRITLWIAEDVEQAKVMAMAGHKTLQTTQWYTHLVKSHLVGLGTHTTVPEEKFGELEEALSRVS